MVDTTVRAWSRSPTLQHRLHRRCRVRSGSSGRRPVSLWRPRPSEQQECPGLLLLPRRLGTTSELGVEPAASTPRRPRCPPPRVRRTRGSPPAPAAPHPSVPRVCGAGQRSALSDSAAARPRPTSPHTCHAGTRRSGAAGTHRGAARLRAPRTRPGCTVRATTPATSSDTWVRSAKNAAGSAAVVF